MCRHIKHQLLLYGTGDWIKVGATYAEISNTNCYCMALVTESKSVHGDVQTSAGAR